MDSPERKILITGATGRQGRSVIEALRGSPFLLLALTRHPSSPAASALKSEPHVHVVQGDLDSSRSMRKVFEDAGGKNSIWGIFMVLPFPGLSSNTEGEAVQGICLADLALENQVSVFIYSSVERGGGETHDDRPDQVGLDNSGKVKIERHLYSLGEQGLRWTILRPVFFMENYLALLGKFTAAVLRAGLEPDTKLPLLSVVDVGRVAAGIFMHPESSSMKALRLTGDNLTFKEQDAIYFTKIGKHIPSHPRFIGHIVMAMNGGVRDSMKNLRYLHTSRIEDPAGYEADLARTRAIFPNLITFQEWTAERGRIVPKEYDKTYSAASFAKLVTGRL